MRRWAHPSTGRYSGFAVIFIPITWPAFTAFTLQGFIPLMHTYHGAKANLDQMQHSALESKNSAVFLAFRRREWGELGPAISSIEVAKRL
jgi:hypothetical protein